jgi:hypothetical protein
MMPDNVKVFESVEAFTTYWRAISPLARIGSRDADWLERAFRITANTIRALFAERDFYAESLSTVYDSLSDARVSKENTDPRTAIQIIEQHFADLAEEQVKESLQEAQAEIARLRHGLEAVRDSKPGSAHRIAVQVLEGNPKAMEATCKPSNTD